MIKHTIYIDASADMFSLFQKFEPMLTDGVDIHCNDPHPDDLYRLLKGYSTIINGHTYLPEQLLVDLRPQLKHIVYLGTGVTNFISLEAAKQNDIQVKTISGYGDRSVAEHTFALLISAARQIVEMDRSLRENRWTSLAGSELKDKTVGVIGLGGVGKEFAMLADSFGMNVVGWNRSVVSGDVACKIENDMATVFENSDFVSLHLDYNDTTHRIVTRELLSRMRPGAVFINSARGELVDTDALVNCLSNGLIAHAAIDVFDIEPLPQNHPLTMLANVTLTAHAAWRTPDASRRLLKRGLEACQHGELCRR